MVVHIDLLWVSLSKVNQKCFQPLIYLVAQEQQFGTSYKPHAWLLMWFVFCLKCLSFSCLTNYKSSNYLRTCLVTWGGRGAVPQEANVTGDLMANNNPVGKKSTGEVLASGIWDEQENPPAMQRTKLTPIPVHIQMHLWTGPGIIPQPGFFPWIGLGSRSIQTSSK